MSFLAVLTESGGCDYTIGCGIAVEPIPEEVESLEAAEQWLLDNGRLRGTEGSILSSATIFTVTGKHKVNLAAIYAQQKAQEAAAEAQDLEQAERQKFAELQKKYGK